MILDFTSIHYHTSHNKILNTALLHFYYAFVFTWAAGASLADDGCWGEHSTLLELDTDRI